MRRGTAVTVIAVFYVIKTLPLLQTSKQRQCCALFYISDMIVFIEVTLFADPPLE